MEYRYSFTQSPLHYVCFVFSPTEEVCFLRKSRSCTPWSPVPQLPGGLECNKWLNHFTISQESEARTPFPSAQKHYYCPHGQPPWVGSRTAPWKATSWQWQRYLPDPPSLKPSPPWSRLHNTVNPRDFGEVYHLCLPQLHISSFSWQVHCSRHLAQCLTHLLPQPHPLCTPNHISALQPFELGGSQMGSASHLPPL